MAQHIHFSWIQTVKGTPEYSIFISDTGTFNENPTARITGTGLGDQVDYRVNYHQDGDYRIKVSLSDNIQGPTILDTFYTILEGEVGAPSGYYGTAPEAPIRVIEYSPDPVEKTVIDRVIDSTYCTFITITVKYSRGVTARTAYIFTGDDYDFSHNYVGSDMLPMPAFGICSCEEIEVAQHDYKPITAEFQYKDDHLYLKGGLPLYYCPTDLGYRSRAADFSMFNALDESGLSNNKSYN